MNSKNILTAFLCIITIFLLSPLYAQLYNLSRIVDLQTIVLSNGEKVRLIGISAPPEPSKNTIESAAAEETLNALKNLFEGKKVRLEYDVQKIAADGIGLAYVYAKDDVQEIFVNAWLIKNGYAKTAAGEPNTKFADIFTRLQKEAAENNRGIWASKTSKTEPAKAQDPKTIIVYVTKSGTKYHREGCRYLDKSAIPITLEEAKKKYEPCKVCNPPKDEHK